MSAVDIIEQLKSRAKLYTPKHTGIPDQNHGTPKSRPSKKALQKLHYGVFDLETQRSAAEVGGWHRADLMRISCAVLYDSKEDRYIDFLENQIPRFVEYLQTFDLVIGFNIKRFDYQVLKGYTDFDFTKLANLDILEEVKNHLGFKSRGLSVGRPPAGKHLESHPGLRL